MDINRGLIFISDCEDGLGYALGQGMGVISLPLVDAAAVVDILDGQ